MPWELEDILRGDWPNRRIIAETYQLIHHRITLDNLEYIPTQKEHLLWMVCTYIGMWRSHWSVIQCDQRYWPGVIGAGGGVSESRTDKLLH